MAAGASNDDIITGPEGLQPQADPRAPMQQACTISVLVEDKPGVLAVAGLFSARGFNIDSLAVGPTESEGLSRMTIVIDVESKPLEQVTKRLNKLINVIKILEHDPGSAVERELMLLKVRRGRRPRAGSWRSPRSSGEHRRRHEDDAHGRGLGQAGEARGAPRAAVRVRDRGAVAHRADRALPRRRGISRRALRVAKAAGAEDQPGWTGGGV